MFGGLLTVERDLLNLCEVDVTLDVMSFMLQCIFYTKEMILLFP